jgi:hypothetical protein
MHLDKNHVINMAIWYDSFKDREQRLSSILVSCEAATDAQLEDVHDLLLDNMTLNLVNLVDEYWGLRAEILRCRYLAYSVDLHSINARIAQRHKSLQ